ncbi:TIGR03757 family integrating conjugative element protein [Morganella morganii]|uniref:TIGR03757 family integrating conjugative element protein n=1 Tax=Morganella morganii TaxID=582 RepID=UPI0013D84B4D|nr:TIGR03757 family integrating conjugative element protein [Morganella morganii]ELB1016310.1 TIGR03757 family integrating conjugative element protein [Morganella morganii]
MKSQNLFIPLLFFPLFSPAAVVFTDSLHPPQHADNHQVVYLDAPEQLQAQFFGMLPADPEEAERVAKTRMQSLGWPRMQRQLMQTYQGVLKAYSLKLAKYPAVVSDDHHVVYGTADVAVAEQLLAEFREAR